MYISNLRKVGGSVMLAVPPAILDIAQLHSGSIVSITVEDGRLIIVPEQPRKYTLQELLAKCDYSAPIPADYNNEWTDSSPEGKELI